MRLVVEHICTPIVLGLKFWEALAICGSGVYFVNHEKKNTYPMLLSVEEILASLKWIVTFLLASMMPNFTYFLSEDDVMFRCLGSCFFYPACIEKKSIFNFKNSVSKDIKSTHGSKWEEFIWAFSPPLTLGTLWKVEGVDKKRAWFKFYLTLVL